MTLNFRTLMLPWRSVPPPCMPGSSRAAASACPAARPGQLWRGSHSASRPSRSFSTQKQQAVHRLQLLLAAVDGSRAEEAAPADAADELPLWRFLRQQGFSEECVSCLQAACSSGKLTSSIKTGMRLTEQKLQHNLARNIAALRAEGLETASIERLCVSYPTFLTTTHTTFNSALAALRQLAALLPDDPRAAQAPPGTMQLGVALWLYPSGGGHLLRRRNLASLIDGNLRLRRQLGISDATMATAIFRNNGVLVTKFERAETMVAHLQHLQASGGLSAEQVVWMALAPGALHLPVAEFDRRWQAGGLSSPGASAADISLRDPTGRQQAAAEALGELLQAADSAPGSLQPQYRQQGEALVQRSARLWRVGHASLGASWASLQQLGLSGSQIVAVAQKQPGVLGANWEGEAKQRQLAWVQQELGLSPYDFLLRHGSYSTHGVAKLAMRADFLRQHRPAVWHATFARGPGPVLSLLTDKRSLIQAGCTAAELDAFNRAWLATPAGRCWGGKIWQVQRQAAKPPQ